MALRGYVSGRIHMHESHHAGTGEIVQCIGCLDKMIIIMYKCGCMDAYFLLYTAFIYPCRVEKLYFSNTTYLMQAV